MLVKDLIKDLQTLDPDMIVVTSADEEGNYFSPVADYSVGKYVAENTYQGQFYGDADYISEINEGYVEEDSGVDAICIWPTN